MSIIETWWGWASFGVILAILELIVPAYVFLGFGVGAGLTALLLLFGFHADVQNLVLYFAVLSVIAWWVMRRIFKMPQSDVKTFDRDINDH